MEYRQRRLKQGRDRVDEIYAGTDLIQKLNLGIDGLLDSLPPFSEKVLLKNAWKKGETYYDIPGIYSYTDERTQERIYYGESVCSIRNRTYRFMEHSRKIESGLPHCEQHSYHWIKTLGRTHAELLEHVSVQYLPLPIYLTKLVESALINKHHQTYGKLPLLNSSF